MRKFLNFYQILENKSSPISNNYVTALFSLLYHMAGYDNGAEALVSSALTESLLSLINWTNCPLENITVGEFMQIFCLKLRFS